MTDFLASISLQCSELGHFYDLSPLYLNHPYINLDYDVIGNVQIFRPERPAEAITDTTCDLPSHNDDVDLSTPLPGPRISKLKVVKQQLLADIKVFTEKVHNISDYASIKSNDAFEEANNVLKIQHGDQLYPEINNSVPIPPRRYENDLCAYKNLHVERADRNNIYGKRRADIMKAQYSVKVPASEKNMAYPQEAPESVVIDGSIDFHHIEITFDINVEEIVDENDKNEEKIENLDDEETFEFWLLCWLPEYSMCMKLQFFKIIVVPFN